MRNLWGASFGMTDFPMHAVVEVTLGSGFPGSWRGVRAKDTPSFFSPE